jgi:hypothetical protein
MTVQQSKSVIFGQTIDLQLEKHRINCQKSLKLDELAFLRFCSHHWLPLAPNEEAELDIANDVTIALLIK